MREACRRGARRVGGSAAFRARVPEAPLPRYALQAMICVVRRRQRRLRRAQQYGSSVVARHTRRVKIAMPHARNSQQPALRRPAVTRDNAPPASPRHALNRCCRQRP